MHLIHTIEHFMSFWIFSKGSRILSTHQRTYQPYNILCVALLTLLKPISDSVAWIHPTRPHQDKYLDKYLLLEACSAMVACLYILTPLCNKDLFCLSQQKLWLLESHAISLLGHSASLLTACWSGKNFDSWTESHRSSCDKSLGL